MKAFTPLFALLIAQVKAVKYGDEKFADIKPEDGAFYVFCNGDENNGPSIDVIGYQNNMWKSLKSIPVDNTTSWADPVYIENCDGKAYMMVGDRAKSQIYVVDPAEMTVIQQVPMSERPVHTYAVARTNEFWAHADGDGFWDIIHINKKVDELFKEDIPAHVSTPGHGKLLFDDELWPYGYVSNTAEPYVIQINMETHQITGHFNFTSYNPSDDFYCPSTHGLAYSSKNGHVYATCSSNGLIELNPSETPDMESSFQIVDLHKTSTGGQVYTSPDQSHIVTLDKANGAVHLLKPNGRGSKSSQEFPSIIATGLGPNQAGAPDKPVFTKNADGTWRLWVSLTTDNTGNSGLGWIDLKDVEDNPSSQQTMNFVAAGSVNKGGYRTYRSIATGGGFVATITDTPTPGLSIVKNNVGDSKAVTVQTNTGLSRVHWVPTRWHGLYCEKTATTEKVDSAPEHAGLLAAAFFALVAQFF